MKKRGRRLLVTVVGLMVMMLSVITVQAETTNCTAITSLPTVISTQGVYCLTDHLATNMVVGNAIEITVNNVIIDLNGYKIGNLAAGNTTGAAGIYAWQRQNITIRNGTIRGFHRGIFLHDASPYTTSHGHMVHDIRADMNFFTAIEVKGTGNVIKNNTVVNTGGHATATSPHGIIAIGQGARVMNNDVTGPVGINSEDYYGILINTSSESIVEGNRVSKTSIIAGTSYAVRIENSQNILVVNNRITDFEYGIYYFSSTGKYRDNLTNGCAVAFSLGSDAGNNS